MLQLHYVPGACSIVPHIALEEASARYQARRVGLVEGPHGLQLDPVFLEVNPKGRVPALVTEQGVITENPAILAYIAQAYPAAQLAPLNDPFAFADVQAFNVYIATSIHVAFRQLVRPENYADGEGAHAALRLKVPELAEHYFALIEQRLADGRPWVHGARYSISDPYLFAYATYLQRGDRGNPELFPCVRAHRRRMLERAAVRKVLQVEELGDDWL